MEATLPLETHDKLKLQRDSMSLPRIAGIGDDHFVVRAIKRELRIRNLAHAHEIKQLAVFPED